MSFTELVERSVLPFPELPGESREIAERAEQNGRTRIREPLVYGLEQRASYYRDLMLVRRGEMAAVERLERHARQMAELPTPEKRYLPESMGAEYEQRVNPNRIKGTGGEFAPPLWINQLFATAPRPGQILQRLAPKFDLPPGVGSVNLPRMTTGTHVTTPPDGAPVENRDVVTEAAESPAVAFAGTSDWALQALEQSPAGAHLDWAVFTDLTEELDYRIEIEFIVGPTGTKERFVGLAELTSASAASVVYTSAVPSGPAMVPQIGKTLAQSAVQRKKPPEALLMTAPRWFWLATSETTTNYPLGFVDYPVKDFPIGGLAGVGTYLDDAIPNTFGTAQEQDVIIACHPSDFVILYSEPRTSVKLDVLSGTLQARFQIWRYVAALLGRKLGTSVLSGTGMTTQTGFH